MAKSHNPSASKPPAAARKAVRVYPDQNVYSRMVENGFERWRDHPIAKLLLAEQKAGRVKVWAGPAHVLETMQASDEEKRQHIAQVILELIEAKRMWWGHEFETIDRFFRFLSHSIPGSVRGRAYFDFYATMSRQFWLGALAILAATRHLEIDDVVGSLRHIKATNRLIHARFAAKPKEWIDKMVDAVDNMRTTTDDVFTEFDQLSVEQMEDEISCLAADIRGLDRKTRERLNKERARIAKAYGVLEVSPMLISIFTLPMSLELTFDVPVIVHAWPDFMKTTGCAGLPISITKTSDTDLLASDITHEVLFHVIRACAIEGLMPTRLGYETILNEIAIRTHYKEEDQRVASGGLTFDADHAASLLKHDIFICEDQILREKMKAMAKKIRDEMGVEVQPTVVRDAHQLEKAIKASMR